MNLPLDWVQIISVGLNSATLIVVVKVVRQFSRLEFKVELMWKSFSKKFGHLTDSEDNEESES